MTPPAGGPAGTTLSRRLLGLLVCVIVAALVCGLVSLVVIWAHIDGSDRRRATAEGVTIARFGIIVGLGLSLAALGMLTWTVIRARADRIESSRLAGQLAESEELHRTTIDSLVEAVAVLDERGRVVRANRSMRHLLGQILPPTNVAGRPWSELFPRPLDASGEVISDRDRFFLRALGGEALIGDLIGHDVGDRRRWFRLNAVGVDRPDGEIALVSMSLVDVTAQHEAEAAAHAALDREHELAAAKSQLISNMSHELRTPLTSTIGNLELLSDGAIGALTAEQRRVIDVVERNSRRLLGLIENALTLSRHDEETMSPALGYVDVADAMASVAESLVPLASSAGLDLVVNGTDGCGSAWVDRDDLIGVLVNVVGNAIKFTPRGGSVMLAVEEQDGDCVVTVSDTGIGIPDSDHGRVFDRFFRSKTSNTDAVPGTGLGLAIASELIERNGGRISLTSTVGVGTTVTIRLPVAEHDARQAVRV